MRSGPRVGEGVRARGARPCFPAAAAPASASGGPAASPVIAIPCLTSGGRVAEAGACERVSWRARVVWWALLGGVTGKPAGSRRC